MQSKTESFQDSSKKDFCVLVPRLRNLSGRTEELGLFLLHCVTFPELFCLIALLGLEHKADWNTKPTA